MQCKQLSQSSTNLCIKDTKIGKGVFAKAKYNFGETVLIFNGKILSFEDLPDPYIDDYYIQIGPDKYMGPSGMMDDFVNHSCNPNCGIKIDKRCVRLIAIKQIEPGEEITWDYSTTMYHDDFKMKCLCGSEICRKVICEYKYLPDHLKRKYVALGIVPDYQ
ncbi:MAG: SET domain-containing protein-lysine N-methyltransferase [Candidatus Peribacteraceae bacterium]|jgi:hypothetical protein